MRRAGALALGGIVWAVGAAGAAGQVVSLELRGGASVGNYSEAYAGLEWEPAPSFAAEAQLELSPSTALYAGYARSSFGCEEGFCAGRDATMTGHGLTLGGRWVPGLPWVRAGLAWQALDVDATGQEASGDAAIGFDLGAGVEFPLGRTVRLRPGVTYRRVPTSLGTDDGHFALLAIEVGVAVRVFEIGSR